MAANVLSAQNLQNSSKQLKVFNQLYKTLDLYYVDTLDAEKNITKPSNKPLRRSPYDYMRGHNETAIIDYNRNQTYNDACRLHGQ